MPHPSASTLRNRLMGRARLRHLQVFVKVAELQTVQRGAQAIGITQPTATQALSDLESLLECRLFLRHARGMTLTRPGQALLPIARRVLGLVDDTATEAAALAHGAQAVVRVGAITAAVGSVLRTALPSFAMAHPEVTIHLQEADSARLASLVADGEVDCALCREPQVLPAGWSFGALWSDRYAIVCGPSHPLSRKRRVARADLIAATWLMVPVSIAARAAFDGLFEGAPEPPRVCSVVTASPVMMESLLVKADLLALVPASVVQAPLTDGRLLELRSPYSAAFGAIGVLAPNGPHDPALSQFLADLTATAVQR